MFNDDRTVIIDLNDKNPPLTYHLKARWAVSNWVEPRMHPVYDVSIGLSPRNMTASLLPFMVLSIAYPSLLCSRVLCAMPAVSCHRALAHLTGRDM